MHQEPDITKDRQIPSGSAVGAASTAARVLGAANWLICAVGNAYRVSDDWTVAGARDTGDGIVTDTKSGVSLFTEHVYALPEFVDDICERVLEAFAHKAEKDETYGRGKVLVIFSQAAGEGVADDIAAAVVGRKHHFEAVWFVSQVNGGPDGGTLRYQVVELDSKAPPPDGCAVVPPMFYVNIADDFCSWSVEREQPR